MVNSSAKSAPHLSDQYELVSRHTPVTSNHWMSQQKEALVKLEDGMSVTGLGAPQRQKPQSAALVHAGPH